MSIHEREGDPVANSSPFLFENPEQFTTPEIRERLTEIVVGHVPPYWLGLPRDTRKYGGAEDVGLNTVTGIDDLGVKKQVIYGNPSNKVLEERHSRVEVVPITLARPEEDLLNTLRTNPLRAQQLERIYVLSAYEQMVDRDDIDIIHDHTNFGRDQGIWVAKSHKPVIRTEHGPLSGDYVTDLEELNLRQFEGRKGMGFVAISENQKSQMPKLNWVGVNYNGVDLRDFEYKEDKADYLLFMGRVCHNKGTHGAIQLAKSLNKRLIIAGAVEETPDSLQYFKKDVEPYIDNDRIVHLSEGVDAGERKMLMSNASCLLMLNEWDEPFGMVMAEAMASGTPVVGYNRGSIPEIVTDTTGYVVENFEEARNAVRNILQGDVSPKECRKRVEKLFSKEAMAARYAQIYIDQIDLFKSSQKH